MTDQAHDPYARFGIITDRDMFFERDRNYFITFGPHDGYVVNLDQPGVWWFPGTGHVVLEPDLEAFYQKHPELRGEGEEGGE